ncbi:MAG: hypothetical protein ACI30I_07855 [Parabacteroides sp.]
MNDDLNIQKLFDNYRPTLTDSERFNQRLERKLALIDEIRREQAVRIHRYRQAVLVAFVAGIVFGGGLLACILATPADTPLFTFGVSFSPFIFIEQNSRSISALLTSLMIAFSIVAALNTHELVSRIRNKGF